MSEIENSILLNALSQNIPFVFGLHVLILHHLLSLLLPIDLPNDHRVHHVLMQLHLLTRLYVQRLQHHLPQRLLVPVEIISYKLLVV